MANIIDAFLVTLGLDAAEFKKGKEEVKHGHEEMREEANKTADYMKEKGAKAGEFFKELLVGAGSFLALFTSFSAIHDYTEKVAEADRTTGRLAKALGITTEELSRYHGAVTLADGTAESFNSSMRSMSGMLVDIEKNLPRANRALTVFKAAGIEGLQLGKKHDILDVIDQLSEKMKAMSYMESLRLGQRMGLDEGTIRLFREGKDTIEEWKKEMGGLSITTQEDVDAFEELEDAQKKTAQAKEGIARIIMRTLRPAIIWFTQAVEKITVWVNQHSDAVRIAFIGIAAAMGVLGLVAAKAAIAVAAATWPLILIAALIGVIAAGIAWVYNEWKKWTEGGESSLGKLFAFLKAGWELFKNSFVTQFNAIKQTISDAIDFIVAQFQLVWAVLTLDGPGIQAAWEKLTAALGRIMKRLFNLILYELGYFISTMLDAWNNSWDSMKEKARKTLEFIKDWWKNLSPGMKIALAAAGGPATLPMLAMPSSGESLRGSTFFGGASSTSSSKSLSINELNIHTQASDAQGIARSMQSALSNTDLVGQADLGMGS